MMEGRFNISDLYFKTGIFGGMLASMDSDKVEIHYRGVGSFGVRTDEFSRSVEVVSRGMGMKDVYGSDVFSIQDPVFWKRLFVVLEKQESYVEYENVYKAIG